MFKDYSGSFAEINGRSKVSPRKKKSASAPGEIFSATRLMWKTIGAMLLVTLVIGISSSFWYSWQVQSALDQIGRHKNLNDNLAAEKRLLIAQRDLLLTREGMEEAAKKIGLKTPVRKQLRYP